jgi:hypothetical protein
MRYDITTCIILDQISDRHHIDFETFKCECRDVREPLLNCVYHEITNQLFLKNIFFDNETTTQKLVTMML